MAAKHKDLLAAADRLEQALAARPEGRGQDWVKRVDGALAGIEEAVALHIGDRGPSDGRPVDVDRRRV